MIVTPQEFIYFLLSQAEAGINFVSLLRGTCTHLPCNFKKSDSSFLSLGVFMDFIAAVCVSVVAILQITLRGVDGPLLL